MSQEDEKHDQAAARFRHLLDLSSDWYWEQDAEYRFSAFSDGLAARGNTSPSAFVGMTRWAFLRLKGAGLSEAEIAAHEALVRAHQPFRELEYSLMTNDGLRHFSISGDPVFDKNGAFAGYRGIGRDVTARWLAQEALRERNAALEAANARLEKAHNQLLQSEKMASVGRLAAGVAHEINNPLGFATGNCDMLARDVTALMALLSAYRDADTLIAAQAPAVAATLSQQCVEADVAFLTDDIPELLNELKSGLDRVRVIVADLRTFAEAGTSAMEQVSLRALVTRALNLLPAQSLERADVQSRFAELPPLACRAGDVSRACVHLLTNALQAVAGGGKLTIETGQTDGEQWVAVEDTGPGIPADIQAYVFDPFFTTRPVGEGVGLGLTQAWGIAEQHGGRIDMDSVAGRGTRMTLFLPISQDA
ncbi:sensor histidine kinase [Denitromonas ohlonensis]|uniref:histidine kinase n=2 Tax=Denitromonas TaxID=139331 RepID=A0A557SNT8_9RHOO|nr:ATP-binding protein [Denitromonas ohlonensis]TVO67024.1 histidine kinase [Denitromonas ohlonensis]TVO79084.1 histidine kinase [Denitromonas ohlonensis]